MTSTELYRQAERVYDERLRQTLEQTHLNYFVAIEPESGDYFLGRTLSDAANAARVVHPDRRTAVLRVGHSSTVHIGSVAT